MVQESLKQQEEFKLKRNGGLQRPVGYIGGLIRQNGLPNQTTPMGYVPQAFGKANRPSTPIQGIISNNYAANYAEEQESVEDKGRSSRPPIGGKMTRARELAIKHQQDKQSKIEYEEK